MINTIKQTWTYKHKMVLLTLGLATAHVIPLIPVPQWTQPTTLYYVATTTAPYSLENEIQARTIELYNANKQFDLERYRFEAIKEQGDRLQGMIYNSPNVDYKAMKDKYGY